MVRKGSLLAIAAASMLGIGASAAPPPQISPPVRNDDVVSRTLAEAPRCPIPPQFRDAFAAAADDARLPAALLAAIAHVESRFQPGARSPQGAVGLLQVMPSTGRALGLDVTYPTANVLAGARFLRDMLDRFRSADVALAAYNAGPAAVERAGGAPSLETLRYVLHVNARWRAHTGCEV
jgi:soluble lytic murein transglycosylase-like protein